MRRPVFRLSNWDKTRRYIPKNPEQGYGIIFPNGEIRGVLNERTFYEALDLERSLQKSNEIKISGWKYVRRASIYLSPGCRIISHRKGLD